MVTAINISELETQQVINFLEDLEKLKEKIESQSIEEQVADVTIICGKLLKAGLIDLRLFNEAIRVTMEDLPLPKADAELFLNACMELS